MNKNIEFNVQYNSDRVRFFKFIVQSFNNIYSTASIVLSNINYCAMIVYRSLNGYIVSLEPLKSVIVDSQRTPLSYAIDEWHYTGSDESRTHRGNSTSNICNT